MKKNLITGLVLSIFALICGGLLALVNAFTEPRIEAARQEKINQSLALVYPGLDLVNTHTVEEKENANVETLYVIKDKNDESIVAVIYIIKETGFNGDIEMMIAVNKNLEITGYTVLSENETKGDITAHDFNMTDKKNTNTFDALAGSTFSSKAVKKCFEVALTEAVMDLG